MASGDDPEMIAPFQAARSALFGMAYRMLGTQADAEDAVQDVFLRWSIADRRNIRNPAAWLMTACTRRSIDMLRSVARTRTDYVGPWLPKPLTAEWIDEPQELSDALETAFLIVLQRASPKERAAFLLHEVFGLAHSEVAATLNVTEEASRKLASRARVRILSGHHRQQLEPGRQKTLLAAFEHAIFTDDMAAFSNVLADDVRLVADGGGKAATITEPLEGRDQVLAFLKEARTWWRGYRWSAERLVTGYGVVLRDGPTAVATIWLHGLNDNRISTVYIMRNPDKLRAVDRCSVRKHTSIS